MDDIRLNSRVEKALITEVGQQGRKQMQLIKLIMALYACQCR